MRKKQVTEIRVIKRGKDDQDELVVDNLPPEKREELFRALCSLGVDTRMAVVIPGTISKSGKFCLNISHDGGPDEQAIAKVVNCLKQTGVMAVTTRTTRQGKNPPYKNHHR